MTTEAAIPEAVGDYTLRGRDIDTCMILGVHDALIDAARLAKVEYNNGFPNWELFRAIYAKDDVHLSKLKRWVHEFGIAYGLSGGINRSVYSHELAGAAGLDALYILLNSRSMLASTSMAEGLGVKPKTYLRIRNAIAARIMESVDIYVLHLGSAYRQVLIYERRVKLEKTCSIVIPRTLSFSGIYGNGDGNSIRRPTPDSDTL